VITVVEVWELEDPFSACRIPSTTGENETFWTDEGCPGTARSAGIVSQQSLPWWPCEAHRINWQHCIACCGVTERQSSANAPRAIVSAATRPRLPNRIPIRL